MTRLQFGTVDRLLQLPASFFGSEPIGALMLRFQAIRSLADGIRSLLSGGLLQSFMTVVYLLFMLRISVKLTVLALVLALLLLIPTALLAVEARRLQRQSEEAMGLAFGRSLELINSVSKLRLAGAESAAMGWWGQEYRRSIVYDQAQKAKTNISTLLQSITPNLGTLLIFITITKLAAEAAVAPPGSPSAPNIGQLLGFLSAFGTFIGSMASIAALADQAVDLPVYLERARPILNTPPEVFPQARDPGPLSGRLEVDRVSYRYNPELPLALDRVSLRMEPGEFVALVGASGCGKSTLIRLLLGFASPEEGVIRYDDQNLSGLCITAVRRQIGTVMQNSGIFSGSILETIAGSAIISLEQAWEAAELVGLADDIKAMPMGMQTMVPEGGGTFSGGQRQRLAIARALVRKPKILIFDEATSALDNRTQAIVTQSLEALAVSRLVVAHRLSTIVHADRIVAFDNGRVVQNGTFDELLADGDGLFAALMRRQIT
jgi:ATP-binding cassette subfamily B protein